MRTGIERRRRLRRRRLAIAATAALAVVAGCGSDDDGQDADDARIDAGTGTGSPGDPLIGVDADGRPYDTSFGDFTRFERAQVATLDVEDGPVGVSPGESLPSLGTDDSDLVTIDLERDDVADVGVDVVWGVVPTSPTEQRVPAAIVLVADRTATVAAWDPFEFGYGTDGGIGGLSTADYRQRNGELSFDEQSAGPVAADDFLLIENGIEVLDDDGDGGDDVVVFTNGFGDGGWPMAFGRDADERIVAVAIWHLQGNWHDAFPDGTPPRDIVEREAELAECLAGEREILEWGLCVSDV